MAETSDEIVRRALETGERLLWLGKPKTGFELRPQDAFLIPLIVAAIFWAITSFNSGPPPFSFERLLDILLRLPFICGGLYIVSVHFILDARIRGRTAYAVTNERVLIVSGLFSPPIKSLQLTSLGEVTLKQNTDGGGTIFFRSTPDFSHPWYYGTVILGTFKLIEDAKSTYDLIRKARRGAFEKM